MKRLIGIILIAIFATSLFAQEDVTPPTLTGFSFTPDAVDVTSEPATVTFTVNATDDISGLKNCRIYFVSPIGVQGEMRDGNFKRGVLDGTVTITITIEQYAEAGDWKVDYIRLKDIVHNSHIYWTGELETMGFPTILTVTSVEDLAYPTLTGFSFTPDAVDVISGPATVTCIVNATDDISGLNYCRINFISPTGVHSRFNDGSFEAGILDGTSTVTITIDQYVASGEWKVDYIRLVDIVGNSNDYLTSELETMGFPTTLTVTSVEDLAYPTLTGFSITPDAVDITFGPAIVTCTVNATDDISGLNSCRIDFISPSAGQYINLLVSCQSCKVG